MFPASLNFKALVLAHGLSYESGVALRCVEISLVSQGTALKTGTKNKSGFMKKIFSRWPTSTNNIVVLASTALGPRVDERDGKIYSEKNEL